MIAVSRKTVMLHLARPGNEQRGNMFVLTPDSMIRTNSIHVHIPIAEPNVLLEDSKLRERLLVSFDFVLLYTYVYSLLHVPHLFLCIQVKEVLLEQDCNGVGITLKVLMKML